MTLVQTPFKTLLKRANRRLDNFFHRCKDYNSALFLDPNLDIVISRLVSPSLVSECFKKVFTFQTNRNYFNYDKILILTTGIQAHLKQYIDLLTNTNAPPKQIIMVFVNRCDYIARQYLEAHGFLHRISVEELRLAAWILDPDLAILEMPNSFIDQIIDGGDFAVEQVSKIIKSFPIYQYFSNIFLIGDAAIRAGIDLIDNFYSAWTHIIIIDRNVDLVTPFLSGFNYESLIAENFDIKYGIVKTPDGDPVLFSEEDNICVQIRNLSYSEAADFVNTLTKEISDEFEEAKNKPKTKEEIEKHCQTVLMNQSLHDHLKFMSHINEGFHKDLNLKINLLSELNCISGKELNRDFIREALAVSPDWRTTIRLFALYNLTNPKTFELDDLCQSIIDRFGTEAMVALWSLTDAKIIGQKKKLYKWSTLFKKFKLYNPEITKNIEKPYEGYTPLTSKLIEKITKKQWNECQDILNEAKIPYKIASNRSTELKRVLIVYIGGSTYGEIATLRNLKYDLRVDFDVLTTELLSCKSVINQLAGIYE